MAGSLKNTLASKDNQREVELDLPVPTATNTKELIKIWNFKSSRYTEKEDDIRWTNLKGSLMVLSSDKESKLKI